MPSEAAYRRQLVQLVFKACRRMLGAGWAGVFERPLGSGIVHLSFSSDRLPCLSQVVFGNPGQFSQIGQETGFQWVFP